MSTIALKNIFESLQSTYGAEAFDSAMQMLASAKPLPEAPAALPEAPAALPEEPVKKAQPSAWNALVTSTVSQMKAEGWPAWTDFKGTAWPASRRGAIKDKSGAERLAYVFDGGAHDGKEPTPALGGMVRASYLKAHGDPVAIAKAQKYHQKRSAELAARSVEAEETPRRVPTARGRPKMTDEQKGAAKEKRAAKKAAAAEVVDMTAGLPAGWAALTEPKPSAPKPSAPKKVDLSFYPYEIASVPYFKNDRGDLVTEQFEWVGRMINGKIDESVEEPTDMDDVSMRE